MVSFQIDVANILDIHPGSIRSLALNESTLKLALFRSGPATATGSSWIEIWDVRHAPYLEYQLTDLDKLEDQPSVEGLVWCQDRLFSCGLHGNILEHDLVSRRIKCRKPATSGPVWCISCSPDQKFIAAGTEDGFINIFEVIDDDLIYLKVLDRQEGRILCLDWSPCGKFIGTGSVDSLRLWDVEKGHAIQRLMTGRSKNTETVVWSILVLDDFIIVSGDSRGIVSFWDGRIGVLKHKVNTHKADILCLKLSSDKSSIYAAGVDPTVVILSRVGRFGDKWVKSHQRNMHTNDVMCLATHGNKLYSAGVDADLIVSSFPPKIVTKYPPILKPNKISYSPESKQVLVQGEKGIYIWRLPTDENHEPLKLLELKSRKQEIIYSASQCPSGKFFAYSTLSRINIFRLSTLRTGEKIPNLQKLCSILHQDEEEDENDDDHEFPSLLFLSETQLVAISADFTVLLWIEIDPSADGETSGSTKGFTMEKTKVEFEEFRNTSITLIAQGIGRQGNQIAVTNSEGLIIIYSINFKKSELTLVSKLPNYHVQVTSLAFQPDQPYLLVTYVDHSIKLWNSQTQRLAYDGKLCKSSLQPIIGSKWSPDGQSLICYEIDKLHLLEFNSDEVPSKPKKRQKKGTFDGQEEKLNCTIRSCLNKYKYINWIDFLHLDSNDLICIEVPEKSLLDKLPPAFAKKRFGM